MFIEAEYSIHCGVHLDTRLLKGILLFVCILYVRNISYYLLHMASFYATLMLTVCMCS